MVLSLVLEVLIDIRDQGVKKPPAKREARAEK